LIAYYTASPGNEAAALDAAALRAHLAAHLPEYMLPAAYVALDRLPLTANGKLDRKALPAPEEGAYANRGYEAPVGEIETALASIWTEVLKRERIGRHDSFFDLGGHSLLAVRVVSLLKKVDLHITVVNLFKYPTIKSLAGYLTSDLDTASKGAIPIRTTGTQRPLFLIHENTGLELWFPLLGAQIDPDVPIYALPAVPLDQPQLRTIESMAARLVQIIRATQPAGPYRVAGWSLGGILAYEVAAQLIGQDQAVELLGLLDTGRPMLRPHRTESPQKFLLDICENVARREALNAEQCAAISGLRESANETDLETLLQKCRDLGVLPEDFIDRSPGETRQHLARLSAHNHAMATYAVQPISIRLHLFVAEQQPSVTEGGSVDPLLGWGAVVPASQIELVRVPGNHFTIMEEPHVRVLGEALSRALEQTRVASTSAPEALYRPYLTIQGGRRGHVPVFCVPGAGDNVIGFHALADALGGEWPVHGLQPRGVEGTYVPYASVETAANAYVQAIRATVGDTPVHLLGHSFGGWVAFEVAQRLRAGGGTVASLTVIDSEAPGADILGREHTHLGVLTEMIRLFELMTGKSLGIDAVQLETLDQGEQRKLLHERLTDVGLMPRRSDPDALRGPLRTFAAAVRTAYRPQQPYPDPVRLVLVRDTLLDDTDDQKRHQDIVTAWKPWAPEVTYWRGPGNHFTVLRPPHVQILADWWRAGCGRRVFPM
jgi:thioesterase domain-containing protein